MFAKSESIKILRAKMERGREIYRYLERKPSRKKERKKERESMMKIPEIGGDLCDGSRKIESR